MQKKKTHIAFHFNTEQKEEEETDEHTALI